MLPIKEHCLLKLKQYLSIGINLTIQDIKMFPDHCQHRLSESKVNKTKHFNDVVSVTFNPDNLYYHTKINIMKSLCGSNWG